MTKKKVIVCGGCPKWVHGMKNQLNKARFIKGKNASHDALKHASVIWVQINCISHGEYYLIKKIARNNGIPVYHFNHASVERCMEEMQEHNAA